MFLNSLLFLHAVYPLLIMFFSLSDDLNLAAVISGALLLCLLLLLCAFGVCYAHRHGYFSREFCTFTHRSSYSLTV